MDGAKSKRLGVERGSVEGIAEVRTEPVVARTLEARPLFLGCQRYWQSLDRPFPGGAFAAETWSTLKLYNPPFRGTDYGLAS